MTVAPRAAAEPVRTRPGDAATKLLGIEGFCDARAKSRFSNAVHWGYGTAWGVPRAVLRFAGLGAAAATAAHGGALWASEQVMLPALGVAPSLWEWGAVEVAVDALHHLVYTVAAGVAYEALG